MEIREQIALTIHNEIPADTPERFGVDEEYKLAGQILALPDLPENMKRLALYPKLVEALEYVGNPKYDRNKEEKLFTVLAEAKKLEGKS